MASPDSGKEFLLPYTSDRSSFSQSDDEIDEETEKPTSYQKRSLSLISWQALVFHALIFALYTMIYVIAWLRMRHLYVPAETQLVYTPAQEAIEYETQVFTHRSSWNQGEYIGDPRDELDEAWGKLLRNFNLRITEEEMNHFPDRAENGIPLPDGGYFASLNVHHNLHCLKRLHHSMYEEHYFPNLTLSQQHRLKWHNQHCIDMLRQSLMCQADTQIITMKWGHLQPIPLGNFTSPHTCVNWEKLDKWAASRRIEPRAEGYLVHPTLGPAFPEGRGDPVGSVMDF